MKKFIIELNYYLKKILEEKSKKEFLKKIIPESKNLVKQLFMKNNNILPNTRIPIYRNNYLELSLIIKERGKIVKQFLYSKL